MSEALVERLREADTYSQQRVLRSRIFGEAADRIEAIEAREARLSEALWAIVARSHNDPLGTSKVNDMRNIATAALSGYGSGWRDGLSEWDGWDQSRHPWGETKHKDAVLDALFRGPWSAEDADALIGFIDRNWTERPAAPQQGGE